MTNTTLTYIDNVAAKFVVGDYVIVKAEVVSFDENSGLFKMNPIPSNLR